MNRFLVLLFISFISFSLPAQYRVQGKLFDEKQKPLKAFTVLLFKQSDSVLLQSALTNESALFEFHHIENGKYLVQINGLGFQKNEVKITVSGKDISLPDIILKINKVELEGVTVIAHKPFLEQHADKLVVNVESSATAAGSTALEVLQKVPGVIVRNEEVSLAGKANVNILINGKSSPYTDVNQLLATTIAANIEKIELITNPGAKYDAAGGAIINIILKKNAMMGTNGNLSFSTAMGLYHKNESPIDRNFYRFIPNFSLNHRIGKWNFYGNINIFRRNLFHYETFERYISNNRFLQSKYQPNDRNSSNYRIGADFFMDDKNTIGILYRGYDLTSLEEAINHTNQYDAGSGALLSSFQTLNNNHIKRNNRSGNINWKHNFDTSGRELNLDLDYSNYQLHNNNDIQNILSNGSSTNSNQYINNPVQFTVLKIDYSQPMQHQTKIETGAKFTDATIDNLLTFKNGTVIDSSRSTVFRYKENIQAVYANFIKKWDDWETNIGLRAEQTNASGNSEQVEVFKRSYLQLFPSFFIARKLDKNLSTVFQYSKRINRPSFQQQNPFIEYADSLTYSKGNPLIAPELMDAYKVGLTYQNQPFFSLSYNRTNDVIFNSAPNQVGNQTFIMPENLGSYENAVVELNFPLNIGKKISGYGGNHLIYNHYKTGYLGSVYDKTKWNWQLYGQVAYKPKAGWNIELSGFYTTRFLSEFIMVSPLGSLNLAVQKSFWDKKGKITLNINDIFLTQQSSSFINYQLIQLHATSLEETRNIRIAFSYSFGNQKLKAVRDRVSASDTETNRVKTN